MRRRAEPSRKHRRRRARATTRRLAETARHARLSVPSENRVEEPGMEEFSDIEELKAIEDIKKLKARRDRSVDLKDWETYTACHAPDHLSDNDGYEPWTREDMVRHLR